jgi:Antitoxin SocA-like, Panacea domain
MDTRAKLREAVHFVCKKMALSPEKLGAVKLQKIIWYFDVKSYLFTGQSATGATFIKGNYGPFAREIGAVVKELASTDRLYTDTEEFFDNEKARFIGKGRTDLSAFSDRERRWLDEISTDICDNHTAGSISERSHGAIWRMAEYGEVIPFAATAIRFRRPSPETIATVKKELGLA